MLLRLDNRERLTYSNWAYGKPVHGSNVNQCAAMKWRTEHSYHGAVLGEWDNFHW